MALPSHLAPYPLTVLKPFKSYFEQDMYLSMRKDRAAPLYKAAKHVKYWAAVTTSNFPDGYKPGEEHFPGVVYKMYTEEQTLEAIREAEEMEESEDHNSSDSGSPAAESGDEGETVGVPAAGLPAGEGAEVEVPPTRGETVTVGGYKVRCLVDHRITAGGIRKRPFVAMGDFLALYRGTSTKSVRQMWNDAREKVVKKGLPMNLQKVLVGKVQVDVCPLAEAEAIAKGWGFEPAGGGGVKLLKDAVADL